MNSGAARLKSISGANRSRLVLLAFAVGALLGIIGIFEAALYAAVMTSGSPWLAFTVVFVPGVALWSGFTFGAWKGLGSTRLVLRVLFWAYVALNLPVIPVGTAVSAVLIWAWREGRGRPAADGSIKENKAA